MPASSSSVQAMERLLQFVLLKNNTIANEWTFLLPPESHEQDEPVRANTIRTLAGGYSDLFGADLPSMVIEGTTGYDIRRVRNGQATDGYQHWLDFLTLMFRVFIDSPNQGVAYRLHYYNWSHQQYYSVMPTAVTWDMATPENTVFYYHMTLTGLAPLTAPGYAPPSISYESLVVQNTAYFSQTLQNAVLHGAMSLTLLGLG